MGHRASSNPFLAPLAPTASPFGSATTAPPLPPGVPAPAAFPLALPVPAFAAPVPAPAFGAPAAVPAPAFGAPTTLPSDAVEVVVDDMLMSADDATHDDAAPSRQELLLRAAELGPARMTWASIVLPADPILGEKMKPRVVERRARFRKIVKAAVGACAAFCLVATAATAVSAATGSSESGAKVTSTIKTAPATGEVPVETLDTTPRGKAPSKVTTTARPAPKAKLAKRTRRH
ncbi:MAG: hypothetical protein KF894_22730 [Labilithrix sp.]|nr:hypothetical protein [Labilithrix sp.]